MKPNYIKPTLRTVGIVWAIVMASVTLFIMAHDSFQHEHIGYLVFPVWCIITGVFAIISLVAGLIAWAAEND